MPGPKAFTIKSERGTLRELRTECYASQAFDFTLPRALHPEMVEFIGLWDTGASGTVVSKQVVQRLGLLPTGKVKVYHANGEGIVSTYLINLALPNGVGFPFLRVSEGDLLGGIDLLIGMDVISQGDFSITNVKGNTTFSFRMPSMKEVDYTVGMDLPATGSKKPGRNEPCPCGSGKKFKQCHGK